MTKVLMVCMGNICRSPMAEGMLRQAVLDAGLDRHVEVDSAGTHAYHIGSAPDPRAQQAIRQRGIDISQLRGRKVADEDFERFDYILVMDGDNYDKLISARRRATTARSADCCRSAANTPTSMWSIRITVVRRDSRKTST